MNDLRSIGAGFVLGAIPGLVWLLVRAMGGLGVNQPLYLVDVVAGPIVFAAIGGVFGALAGMLLTLIHSRNRQPIAESKSSASLAGFLIGMVPGLNGLVFASVFLRCGGDDALSGYIAGCDDLRTVYVLSSTAIAVTGGLVGAMVGRFLATRHSRRSLA